MHVDLSGRVSLELIDPDPPTRGLVERRMRPFTIVDGPPPARGDVPNVILERAAGELPPLVEVQGPAGDDLTTATDGGRLWEIRRGLRCSIPDALDGTPPRFTYESGFQLGPLFRSAVRPAVQIALAAGGDAAAVHAASVTLEGRAIIVAGWSESGKTETALGLMERGAGFLSDKWTLLGADGEASPFPITVGIRRWVLAYLPTLARAQTPQSRLQFAAARAAGAVMRPIVRAGAKAGRGSTALETLGRTVALADRSAYEIADLREAYQQTDDPVRRVPTAVLALLATIPSGPVTVEEEDPAIAALRLARTAAYERRPYLGMLERAAYLSPDAADTAGASARAIALDEAVLRRSLASIRVLRVRAPFPTDPTGVADAILHAL